MEDLESKLVELNNRLLVIDEQLKDVTDEMSSSTSRPEESEIRSTKLVRSWVGPSFGLLF